MADQESNAGGGDAVNVNTPDTNIEVPVSGASGNPPAGEAGQPAEGGSAGGEGGSASE